MVKMEKDLYDAAMSMAKATLQGEDRVRALGMSHLNASPLHLAASQNDLDFVKTALGEIPQLAEAIDSRNQTPLHLASAEGHILIVKELVSASVDTCTYQDILGRNPLHVAVMKGHLEIVTELVSANVANMCTSRDRDGINPLHVAVMNGHIDIVKELVKSANIADMCTSRDLGGRNPLHVAAMNGKVDALEELLKAWPYAAQARVDQETILHLCVKHNQVQALKLLLKSPKVHELVNATDAGGNTASHLAAADTMIEVVEALLQVRKIDMNIKNAHGCTTLDTLHESKPERGNNSNTTGSQKQVFKKCIRERGAIPGYYVKGQDWLNKRKDAIIVVSALIATVAFQVIISPPGGVWQDDKDGHKAGEPIIAYNYPENYKWLLRSNSIAFMGAGVSIILLTSNIPVKDKDYIMILAVLVIISVFAMIFAYGFSITAVMGNESGEIFELIQWFVVTYSVAISVVRVITMLPWVARAVKAKYDAYKITREQSLPQQGLTPQANV